MVDSRNGMNCKCILDDSIRLKTRLAKKMNDHPFIHSKDSKCSSTCWNLTKNNHYIPLLNECQYWWNESSIMASESSGSTYKNVKHADFSTYTKWACTYFNMLQLNIQNIWICFGSTFLIFQHTIFQKTNFSTCIFSKSKYSNIHIFSTHIFST